MRYHFRKKTGSTTLQCRDICKGYKARAQRIRGACAKKAHLDRLRHFCLRLLARLVLLLHHLADLRLPPVTFSVCFYHGLLRFTLLSTETH